MFLAAVVEVVDALRDADVLATYDPRNLATPGALVAPSAASQAGVCSLDVDVDVFLVAPGPANGDALRTLDGLVGRAVAAGLDGEGELVGYEHPVTGDVLAAWRLSTTRTVTTRP